MNTELSFEMQQVNSTLEHIRNVQRLLNLCMNELGERAVAHDATKFSPSEWPFFLEHTEKLAGLTYGSQEYKDALKELGPALKNHYKQNRHHPEYHLGGFVDMTLLDLLEMLCDWMAATKRHKNGDIHKSIEQNRKRFNYGFQLEQIFNNTVNFFERK